MYMWIYVVVLMQLGTYKVHAPNVVFIDQQSCEEYQEFDRYRLLSTAPSSEHKMWSMCTQIPREA